MRSSHLLLIAASCAVVACGGEPRASAPAEPKATSTPAPADLERFVDPKADLLVELDAVALRKANGLPPDADLEQKQEVRTLALSALPWLITPWPTLAHSLDHGRITRVLFDGEVAIIATDQPYEEISQKLQADDARVVGSLTIHGSNTAESFAVASGGEGVVLAGFDAAPVEAAAARTDGRVPERLRRTLDTFDDPIRGARRPKGCVKGFGVGAGRGEEAVAAVDVAGAPSPARVRLGKDVAVGTFTFQAPSVEGARLTVPFRVSGGREPTLLLAEDVYRCS